MHCRPCSILSRHLPPLTLALLPLVLSACQLDNVTDQLPPGQPFPSARLAELRPNMTYGEFEAAFGPGWISHSSPTGNACWFFDDGHIISVPPEIRSAPAASLKYRLIGPPLTTNH